MQADKPMTSSWTGRRMMAATLTVLSVAFAFFLLIWFRDVVFALFLAIVLSIAIAPAVDILRRVGLPRWLGVCVVYVVLLLLLLGAVALMLPLIMEQVTAVIAKAPAAYQTVRIGWLASGNAIMVSLAAGMPAQLIGAGGTGPVGSVDQAVGFSPAIDSALVSIIFVFALAFNWTLDREILVRSLLLRLPSAWRDEVRDFVGLAESKVGAFLRGQAILSLVVAVAMTIWMFLIGMPSPLVLGIVAGLFEAVPLLGPFLGAILPLLLAITGAPDKIIWVVVAVVVIQQLEGQVLVPRVMNAAVGVNPILTILVFTAFTGLLGLTGAILSVPIAAVIQIMLDRFVSPARMSGQERPSGRDRLSVLRMEAHDLVEDVRRQQRQKRDAPGVREDQVLDMTEAIAADLESMLAGAAEKEVAP
jgi:predicted PurR-regulated permease PerM